MGRIDSTDVPARAGIGLIGLVRARCRGGAAIVIVAGLFASIVAQSVPATAAAKPDLIVPAGEITSGDEYWFIIGRGQTSEFIWRHRTKNIGTAPSAKSRTALIFDVGEGDRFIPEGGRLRVPRLPRGESHSGRRSFEMHFDEVWDYGTYPTRICADVGRAVAERKEGNNCKKMHPIYVVPFDLKGSITGSAVHAVFPGVTLSWDSAVTFELQHGQPFADEGILEYHWLDDTPQDGPFVLYTVQGQEPNGCSWSGSGGYEPSQFFDGIELSFTRGHGRYHAQILVDPNFHFTATVSCPNGGGYTDDVYPAWWGRAAYWFDIGPGQTFPDPGLTQLEGDYTDSNATYSWNLLPGDLVPD